MPASVQIITDLTAAVAITPNATSTAAAIAAAGPIQSIPSNVKLCLLKAQELKVLLTALDAVVHSSDTTLKAKIADTLLSLV